VKLRMYTIANVPLGRITSASSSVRTFVSRQFDFQDPADVGTACRRTGSSRRQWNGLLHLEDQAGDQVADGVAQGKAQAGAPARPSPSEASRR